MLALAMPAWGAASAACAPGLAVVALRDAEVVQVVSGVHGFSLSSLHSVTLTPVIARYRISASGALIQVEERYMEHGPGLSHTEPALRADDGTQIVTMRRPIERLILRAHPRWGNHLVIEGEDSQRGETIDLTRWPDQALHLQPIGCQPAPSSITTFD